MQTSSVDNGYYQSVKETHNAGFLRRLAAYFIDAVLLGLILAMSFGIFYGDTQWLELQSEWSVNHVFYDKVLPLVLAIVFWVKKAATPGKMVMSTQVLDAKTGLNVTPGQALLRYVGYFISAIPLGLGFIWILFDEQNRGWHDMLAGTVVVKHA